MMDLLRAVIGRLNELAQRVSRLEHTEYQAGSENVLWSVIQASQLANEVMNFPANVGIDIDLDAVNQWWDKVGTPSTAVTMVDVAGEAGITETWEYALKTICDAAGEGFSQRYTYADQPRIKAGRKLSAIAAVWVGTADTTVTMKLVTSQPTEVSATATAQGWTIIKCEGLALDGTYVDLQFTTDTADTFYAVPLGVCIGEKAVPLGPRPEMFVEKYAVLVNAADPGGAFVDVDVTANTEPLARAVRVQGFYKCDVTSIDLLFRCNGDSVSVGVFRNWAANTYYAFPQTTVYLDDANVFEYGTTARAEDTEAALIYLTGYWRWG